MTNYVGGILKQVKDIPIGTIYGHLTTIGRPFAIRIKRRYVYCVAECTKCGTVNTYQISELGKHRKVQSKHCNICVRRRNLIKKEDIQNLKIGSVTIIGHPFKVRLENLHSQTCVVVECDCGNIYVTNLSSFKRKQKISTCGICNINNKRKENKASYAEKQVKYRLRKIWYSIHNRCKKHTLYIEKGISICEEWQDFNNFKKWAYDNGYVEEDYSLSKGNKLSIDRIYARKGYFPENCRWIPLKENVKNISRARDNMIESLEKRCEYLESILQKNNITY